MRRSRPPAKVSEILDVYHAFDSINADRNQLSDTISARQQALDRSDKDHQAELHRVRKMGSAEGWRLFQRHAYSIGSLLGRTSFRSLHDSTLIYAAHFSSTDRCSARRRAQQYNAAIDYAAYTSTDSGLVRSYVLAYGELERKSPLPDQRPVLRLADTSRQDPDSKGRAWISMTNPRALEIVGTGALPDGVEPCTQEVRVAAYRVNSMTYDETTGIVQAAIEVDGSAELPTEAPVWVPKLGVGRVLQFQADSDTYRLTEIDDETCVEVYIPPGRTSVAAMLGDYSVLDRVSVDEYTGPTVLGALREIE